MANVNHIIPGTEIPHQYADLTRLRVALAGIQDQPLVDAVRFARRRGGRRDWPPEAMLNSLYAMIVFQLDSVAQLRRQLASNPSLLHACGFPVVSSESDDDTFKVPSAAAYSRLIKVLVKLEKKKGQVSKVLHDSTGQLSQLLPGFGRHLGFDGKALRTHSTGRKCRNGKASDRKASWGKHVYHWLDPNGKERTKTVIWFGYKIHVLSDVEYELPIDVIVRPAHRSEHKACRLLVERHWQRDWAVRCEDFVADRGLDSNALRAWLHQREVIPVVGRRRMWKHDKVLSGFSEMTKALYEDRVDTIVYTETGKVMCKCPATGKVRQLQDLGYERDRDARKYGCPDLDCAGRAECHRAGNVAPGTRQRRIRIPVDPQNMHCFGRLPEHSAKYGRISKRRSATERINARLTRDFKTDDHFVRGKTRIRIHVTLRLAVMVGIAAGAVKSGNQHRMRSLVLPMAA